MSDRTPIDTPSCHAPPAKPDVEGTGIAVVGNSVLIHPVNVAPGWGTLPLVFEALGCVMNVIMQFVALAPEGLRASAARRNQAGA